MQATTIKTAVARDPRQDTLPADIPAAPPSDTAGRPLCRISAFAALATVAIAIVQAPLFILSPQPTTVLGHFEQFQRNRLLGLFGLDLTLLIGEALAVVVLLGLYGVLRRAAPSPMAIALGLGLGGITLFFTVNPTLAMLYLSDQYTAATSDAQRSTFLAAGEALWANYNGTAFGLFFVLTGVADLIIARVMLHSGMFSKATAWVGILLGVMLLVPPLPPLGTIPLVLSYLVIIPSIFWNLLVARGLLRIADRKGGHAPTRRHGN